MKRLTVFFIIIIATISSCKEDDKLIFEEITDNVGTAGGLRTIEVISPSIDLNDLANSRFEVEVEEWDDEDGNLLDNVDVFVEFQDFTPDNGDSSKSEVLFNTIEKSEFTDGPDGLPRTTISVSASSLISLFGLDPSADIDGGDVFRIRLSLNLTDGSIFSSDNLEGNITGVFFNSPFSYPANVVCELDESLFSGTYNMEFVSGTFSAGFGTSDAYSSGEVNIIANSGTQRVVQNTIYLPAFGGFAGSITFDLVCGRIIVPNQTAAAACTTSIQQASGENVATFDPTNDSEFLLIFNDELTSDCGAPTYEVILRFTKV